MDKAFTSLGLVSLGGLLCDSNAAPALGFPIQQPGFTEGETEAWRAWGLAQV